MSSMVGRGHVEAVFLAVSSHTSTPLALNHSSPRFPLYLASNPERDAGFLL